MKKALYHILMFFASFALLFFVLSAAVFYLSRLAPGDPLVSYYGERAEKMLPIQRQKATEKLGLNEDIHIQYAKWLSRALKGDFGISYKYKIDVLSVIRGRMLNTALLGGIGFLLIFLLAFVLGIFCALSEGSIADRVICWSGTALSCVPEFWLSLMLILVFSSWLKVLPSSGAYSAGNVGSFSDRAIHLALPLSSVVISHLWYYAYFVRNKMLEELRAGYVLLAKAKGLGKRGIISRHCLRNVLPSYLGIMAISAPHILGGTYIVEAVFSYPGVGMLAYESARYQDYNLFMAVCLVSGAAVILCSLAAQSVGGLLDPRIQEAPGEGQWVK